MKVMMHICCANCAIFPIRVLREQNHLVTGLFYNPNIHPYQEYRKRLDAVRDYARQTELEVIYRDDYALEEFLARVATTPDSRCNFCYQSRLEETARRAAGEGFDAFTTSLLYSRFQKHDLIREFGLALSNRHGVDFLYQDFRSGWKEGIDASRSMGLYRQQYCGCIYSEKDRFHPRSSN